MGGKDGTGVLRRYARLFEPPDVSHSRSRREASAAARACFEAMRSRFAGPDAAYVIGLLIRLGEVGSLDFYGSLRTIGEQIGGMLGEVIDVARLYRGVRALHGNTCVVERVSRQLWRLRLAGASDPASPHHRQLLAETPTPYRLGAGDDDDRGRVELSEEASSLRHRLALAEESAAAAADERDQAREELLAAAGMRDQARDEAEAARHELADLRQQCTDAKAERIDAGARQYRLEETIVQRTLENEDLVRQLAELRAALEQTQVRPVVAVGEDGKIGALKGALKLERERRHAADVRLRRILSVLRAKLAELPDEDPEAALLEYSAEELEAAVGGFGRVLLEFAAERRRELAELEQSAAPDPERLAVLRQDVEMADALARHAPA
jgi:hypothetical protein